MKITRIHHVAIALNDTTAMDAVLGDAFALPPPYRERSPRSPLDITIYKVGDSAIELLRPDGPGSSVPAFIAEKGEGLFHLCLEVEDLDSAIAELQAKGLRLRPGFPNTGHGGTRVAFLDPATTGGVLFELLEPARGAEAH